MNRVAQHSPPAAMRLAAWATGLLLLGAAFNNVHAAGTTAGTDVSNTATVNYSVGGVGQPVATSNTVTFEVDRRVNLTVAEVGADYTDVSPGQTDQALSFDVTNLSNSPLDFRLSFTQDTTGTASPTGFTPAGTDNFNTTNVRFYLDDGDNVFDAGDTLITFLDEVPADGTRRVHVVSDIPAGQANASIAGGTLTAIAAQSTNVGTGAYVATVGTLASDAAETNTGSTDDPVFIDTVFGDTGAADGNTAQDGQALDDDAYYVVAATIAVTKSRTVVSDPINGTTNPKSIPGAVVEYCINIANSGASAATTVVVSDAMPANTTYVAGSIKSASTGAGTSCDLNSGTVEDDDNVDIAELDGRTADFGATAGNTVTIRINSIGAAATEKMLFRVTVN